MKSEGTRPQSRLSHYDDKGGNRATRSAIKGVCLLVFLGVMCTSQGADIERHWKSGCSPDNWAVQTAGMDITVNYSNMSAGTLHIRRANGTDILTQSISAGSGSFTVPHFVRSGYSGQNNNETSTESDYIATNAFLVGGPSLPVSGGKLITQHTVGPSAGCFGTSGETSTEVNNTITYTVNASAESVKWVVNYTGPSLYSPGELDLTAGNGSYYGVFPIPGGGTLSTTHSIVGGSNWSVALSANLQLAVTVGPPSVPVYFTVSPSSGTIGTTGVEVFTIAVTGTTAQPSPSGTPNATATPRATPTPGSSPTPVPTPTPPGPNVTPGASVTPPPMPTPGHNYPSPTPGATPGGGQKDVYYGVRDALNQSGNADTTGSSINGTFQFGDNPAAGGKGQGTDDTLERMRRMIADDTAKMKQQTDMLRERFGTEKRLKLPPMTGSKMLWNVSFPFVQGRTLAFTLDVSPYAQYITYFRNVCLLGMYIFFWAVTIKTLQKAFA